VSVLAFSLPKWSMAYLELPPSFAKSMALVSVLPSGKSKAGKSYVVFGKANNSAINLSAIADASNPLGT
jgi:hypothetical protein